MSFFPFVLILSQFMRKTEQSGIPDRICRRNVFLPFVLGFHVDECFGEPLGFRREKKLNCYEIAMEEQTEKEEKGTGYMKSNRKAGERGMSYSRDPVLYISSI